MRFLQRLSGATLALALCLAGYAAEAANTCAGPYVEPSVSSVSPGNGDNGTIYSPKNATGASFGWAAASLPIGLPLPSDVANLWSICATTDANKAVTFTAPSLAAPATPTLSSTSGGTAGARTYYVKVTYVNAVGETVGSTEAPGPVGANNLLVVASPGAVGNATSYNVYAATSTGAETKQNASPIAIGTNWTEPLGGLISGSALPTSGSATAAYILTGNQTLSGFVLGPDNGQYIELTSDGTNYRVKDVSTQALAINGAARQYPGRWVYPGGPGYQATVGDTGNVISSAATSGGLTVAMPPPSTVPPGWMVKLSRDTQPLTVEAVSGGSLLLPDGTTAVAQTLPAQNHYTVDIQFDGANFRMLNGAPVNPASAAGGDIDVFIATGQSNMLGAASDGFGGPPVPHGLVLAYTSDAGPPTIADANDPVGQAVGGGPVPAFGITYNALTGHKVLIVQAAIGNTDMCAAEDAYIPGNNGNWDTTGTHFARSLGMLNTAIPMARSLGYNPILRGVLWALGENSALAIQNSSGAYTALQHQTCLNNMVARWRSSVIDGKIWPELPFYISALGGPASGDTTYFQQIRAVQEFLVQTDATMQSKIAFRGAVTFINRGLMCPACGGTNVHYEQAGYNEMGRMMAETIVGGARADAWQRLGNFNYGSGNNDIAWPFGRVAIGKAQDSLNPYNASLNVFGLGTVDNPAPPKYALGTYCTASPGSTVGSTDCTGLRVANEYYGDGNYNHTTGQTAGILLQPSLLVRGDGFGALIRAIDDGTSLGSTNISFGSLSGGAFTERFRMGMDGGFTTGGYTGNFDGGLGAGTGTLYHNAAAGQHNHLLFLLNKNGAADDQRVGILFNPSGVGGGDSIAGGTYIEARNYALTGISDLYFGGYRSGGLDTRLGVMYATGGFAWGATGSDPGADNMVVAGTLKGARLGVSALTTWANNQTCIAGEVMVDSAFLYACTAANTVKRIPLSSF